MTSQSPVIFDVEKDEELPSFVNIHQPLASSSSSDVPFNVAERPRASSEALDKESWISNLNTFITDKETVKDLVESVFNDLRSISEDKALSENGKSWIGIVFGRLKGMESSLRNMSSIQSKIRSYQSELSNSSIDSVDEPDGGSSPGSSTKKVTSNSKRFSAVIKGCDNMRNQLKMLKTLKAETDNLAQLFDNLTSNHSKVIELLANFNHLGSDTLNEAERLTSDANVHLQNNTKALKLKVASDKTLIQDETSLDFASLCDAFLNPDVSKLMRARKEHLENIKSVQLKLKRARSYFGLAKDLSSLYQNAASELFRKAKANGNEFEEQKVKVIEIFSQSFGEQLHKFRDIILIFLRFEQVRIQESKRKLKENEDREKQHLFLYDDTELNRELESIRQNIQDFNNVVTISKSNIDSVADSIGELFAATLQRNAKQLHFLFSDSAEAEHSISELISATKEAHLNAMICHLYQCFLRVLLEVEDHNSRLFKVCSVIVNFAARLDPKLNQDNTLTLVTNDQPVSTRTSKKRKSDFRDFADETFTVVLQDYKKRKPSYFKETPQIENFPPASTEQKSRGSCILF